MKLIETILIANRGEIAHRIIRTCRKMGIRSVAVFSEADRHAPFVKAADLALCIGDPAPAASYLDQDKIIAAAKQVGADAIHPGYGFLSENAGFASYCQQEDIIFIGPNPAAIEAMGSKSKAKALMRAHKVPVVPGYQGVEQDVESLQKAAQEVGYPLLLKATAGGGGKGMRIVEKAEDLPAGIDAAKREAQRAFGDDELLIEKYVSSGRHIEFQIFGDQHGNTIHLLERECTIQRRYQKVIEESPSPVLDPETRELMGQAAVNAAKALQYDNAGTVEFIYEEQTKSFYFLEVNTRLQVEHPVTEAITGLDLVQLQIEVAQGLPLPLQQEDVKGNGYAIEARLYAEDANHNFLPVTGTVHRFEIPEVEGLRVDAAIESGSEITIHYDPMIAKLIVWDRNRIGAHRKLRYVLQNLQCLGTTTNQDFLLAITKEPSFQKGDYDTHFIGSVLNYVVADDLPSIGLIAITLFGWQKREQQRKLLKHLPSGWRNSFNDYQKVSYTVGERDIDLQYRYLRGAFVFILEEKEYAVQLLEAGSNSIRIEVNGQQHTIAVVKARNRYYIQSATTGNQIIEEKDRYPRKEIERVKGAYNSPMPSQIIKILVEEGQAVKAGDGLMVLSSMKMENTIEATEAGEVEEIYTTEGANVEAGFLLLKVKPTA